MSDWIKIIVGFLIFVLLVGGSCGYSCWRYKDCLKVGHSKWYCIGEFAK